MRNIAKPGITTCAVIALLVLVCTKICADTVYVGQAGTPSGNYYTDIQSAVDAAMDGDIVLVSNGVYDTGARITPGNICSNRVVITNNITVKSVRGAESTVILGNGPNGDNAVRGIYMSVGILDGFTVSNGHTIAGGNPEYDNNGGGVNMYGGSGILSNCIVSGNSMSWPGNGGGVYGGTVAHSVISGNYSDNRGGGTSLCIVYNSVISGNTASDNGGGTSYGTINNCLIKNNLSDDGGGGCFNSTLNNCTIIDNRSTFVGGGTAWCTVNNCIVLGNTAPQSNNYYSGTIHYSCSWPLPAGDGNISNNPPVVAYPQTTADISGTNLTITKISVYAAVTTNETVTVTNYESY